MLKTSDKAYGETDLAQLSAGDDLKPGEGDLKGPLTLAAAVDTKPEKKEGEKKSHGGRVVVVGDSNWLGPTLLRQPELANVDLLASITGYLCEREALVAIAPRKVEGQRHADHGGGLRFGVLARGGADAALGLGVGGGRVAAASAVSVGRAG